MLPIFYSARDGDAIAKLRGKLSLRPLLLEGLDEEEAGGGSKFEVVRGILREVQRRGDAALIDYTKRLDGAEITAHSMRVGPGAVAAAVRAATPAFLRALDVAVVNLRRYQEAMMAKEPAPITLPGTQARLGMKFTPIERVGLYVPGGAAAYPTSVLHTAIPAKKSVYSLPSASHRVAPSPRVSAIFRVP